jgi:hypothetical protein
MSYSAKKWKTVPKNEINCKFYWLSDTAISIWQRITQKTQTFTTDKNG